MEIFLEAKLPPAYPNEQPELRVEAAKGLDDEQTRELQALAEAKAEENMGMAMVYTIAEELREWLLARNEPPTVRAAPCSVRGRSWVQGRQQQ